MKPLFYILLSFVFLNTALSFEYKFNGIARFSNCSGSLVRFEGQDLNSKAMVLTNGHCLGKPFIKPDEKLLNKPYNRKIKIFNDKNYVIKIYSETILYATMTKTDIALLELSETYIDLKKKYGIESFSLSKFSPSKGMKVEMLSGLKNMVTSCHIEEIVSVLQEGSWFFENSLRYSGEGCISKGGTSGSPIVSFGDRSIVAINNTRNQFGFFCIGGNPCEVLEDGIRVVRRGASYGQQTSLIYTCLNNDFKIDLSLNECLLPR